MYINLRYQIILVKRNNIMENSRNLVHQLIGSYQIDKSKSKYEKSPILKDTKKPIKKHGNENLVYKYKHNNYELHHMKC